MSPQTIWQQHKGFFRQLWDITEHFVFRAMQKFPNHYLIMGFIEVQWHLCIWSAAPRFLDLTDTHQEKNNF